MKKESKKATTFKRIVLLKNIVSILLYTLSTLIWVKDETASPILKTIAFVSLGLYILMFVVIAFYSKENFKKNLKKYKKTVKTMKTTLKFLNLLVLVITTISVFSFSIKNLLALTFNIILLGINILSFIFKFFLFLAKRKFNKMFKKDKNEKQTFFGFLLDDDIYENEQTNDLEKQNV